MTLIILRHSHVIPGMLVSHHVQMVRADVMSGVHGLLWWKWVVSVVGIVGLCWFQNWPRCHHGYRPPLTKLKQMSRWHIYSNTLTITCFPTATSAEREVGVSFPGMIFTHYVYEQNKIYGIYRKSFLTLTSKVPRFLIIICFVPLCGKMIKHMSV